MGRRDARAVGTENASEAQGCTLLLNIFFAVLSFPLTFFFCWGGGWGRGQGWEEEEEEETMRT